ncbi:peroxidase-like [Leptopilina heterotoma]|uniref:peroxidase-like n=1 Tax=Leptopilina heterotoma TaxID=63436 RepID=UPI001CAA175F|nr:peroxidase-like [Leptopilina heterotoma]
MLTTLLITGDRRSNAGIQLAFFFVTLVRQHNHIAGKLLKFNPHWNDERIYQEARRIYIAISQQITYNEFLPILLGRVIDGIFIVISRKNNFNAISGEEYSYQNKIAYNTPNYVNDYNPTVDAGALNEMVAAVMRSFHTLLNADFNMINEKRDPPHGKAIVNNVFNNPTIVEKGDNYDCLMRGLATQPQEGADQYYDKMVTHIHNISFLILMLKIKSQFTAELYLGEKVVKTDGRALDIQRGRDYGLGTYNQYREFCGLRRGVQWDDFLDYIPQEAVKDMKSIYESPEDVDLTVGGSVENLAPGALVGPTFQCLLNKQYSRSRIGDRFFFENGNYGNPFTLDQLNEIRKYTISRLICDNTNIESMQRRGFEQISKQNPLVSCKSIPEINLSLWKE